MVTQTRGRVHCLYINFKENVTMRRINVRFAAILMLVLALGIAGAVFLASPGSSILGTAALSGLVGGEEISPACGFGTGVAAGLAIGGIVAAPTPVGAALGISAIVVGFIVYVNCTS
jgi:hypothetical protein